MPEHASQLDLVPAVTAAQMREVDRVMVEDLGISLLQMMENAGRALAELTRIQLSGLNHRRVVILAGRGGNGGGGMGAARRLATWGAEARVVLAHPDATLAEAPAHQLASLRAMGVPVHGPAEADSLVYDADVVLDSLLGYSLDGPPREPEAELIRTANSSGVPILALDLPSGLDPDRGLPHDPTIRATCTLALALPKVGLLRPEAAKFVGELWLADISVPASAYARFAIAPGPLFAESDLIRIAPGLTDG
jgi:NAD(P)H-hydrate epimerase